MKPTRRDYCQFLLVTQKNYTQTYFTDHHPHFSHDAINRYLINDNIRPGDFWNKIKSGIDFDSKGYLIFDDTVINKEYAKKIESAQKQYSENVHGLVNGIGVVNCVYVNPKTEESWILDWRIFDPKRDGKTKLDHLIEMFDNAINAKKIPFRTVLMDSWYATKDVMMHIDQAGKFFYCPLKSNRKVDDKNGKGKKSYRPVDSLDWSPIEETNGKIVKVHQFPGDKKVKLFRVVVSNRTEWVVTNEFSETNKSEDNSSDDDDINRKTASDAGEACGIRWKIEQYHRETKQTLGLEKCQCRKAIAQKNHIGCVAFAWHFITKIARTTGDTVYAIKERLLSDYMRTQLAKPTLVMPSV